MERYYNSTFKSLLAILIVLASFSTASAQFFANYSPTQPCVNDSVLFVYGGQGGNLPTNITIEWGYYNTPSGTGYAYSNPAKIKFDSVGMHDVWYNVWDSTTQTFLDSGVVRLFVDSICADNIITGTVFNDDNGNGLQDAGETGIGLKRVELQPGYAFTYTDANGDYEMQVRPGSYTVGITTPLYYNITAPTSPSTHSINFPTSGGSSAGNDFGIHVQQNVNDLRVSLVAGPVRPGFDSHAWLNYQNIGTNTIAAATLTYTPSASLTFLSSTPAPDNSTATTQEYNLGTLAPGAGGYIYVQLNAPAPPTLNIGDVVTSLLTIDPTTGDYAPDDNIDTLAQTVVGSFDPNDKAVFPAGEGEAGTLLPVQTLRYLIRFQNTGTYYAEDVRVEDTLDTQLDILSVRTLDASHSFTYTLDPTTGGVVWYFNDIMLPDSNANEPMSHGYISFEVDVIDWDQVPNGSEINNTAHIYFDFNEAIVTNTTRTTFDRTVGIAELAAVEASKLYPNPVNGKATIEFASEGRNYHVRVMDLTGKVVLNTNEVSTDRIELDVTNLNGGMYLYEIVSEGKALSKGKFIIK